MIEEAFLYLHQQKTELKQFMKHCISLHFSANYGDELTSDAPIGVGEAQEMT